MPWCLPPLGCAENLTIHPPLLLLHVPISCGWEAKW